MSACANWSGNLAGTEEKTGLLKRSSYVDVLLSEAGRALQQGSALSVALLKFTVPPQKDRSANEAVLDNVLQQVGRLVTARIRQSAVAVRYARNTLALILADTKEKEARHTLDRLRLEMANPLPVFTAGIAEAVLQQGYEPADVITELINRTEDALQTALRQGGYSIHVQAPWNETETAS